MSDIGPAPTTAVTNCRHPLFTEQSHNGSCRVTARCKMKHAPHDRSAFWNQVQLAVAFLDPFREAACHADRAIRLVCPFAGKLLLLLPRLPDTLRLHRTFAVAAAKLHHHHHHSQGIALVIEYDFGRL